MKSKILILALLMTLGLTARATNLVVNGSFETGDFSGWSGAGDFQYMSIFSGGAQDGNFALSFGPVGAEATLSQAFATSSGASYDISWWLQGNGTSFSDLSVYWNGITVSYTSPVPDQSWTNYTVSVTGTGSDVLTIGFRNDPSFDQFDNVSLTQTSSGVPDGGATVGLLGGALLGLAALRRRFGRN